MSTFDPNQSVKLTKSVVERLPSPASGQVFYRDSELKGFGLRITAGGTRSFILEKRIEGRVKRQTIGRFGELTCEQARRQALKLLGQVALGINPIRERERERLKRITLQQAFEDFKKARKHLKPKTVYDYERILAGPLGDWRGSPLKSITRDKVLKRHREIGETRGHRYANLSMRFLSSLMNFAVAHYEDGFGEPVLEENPVRRLSQMRAWYRNERRRSVIKVHQLPAWYRAVQALRQEPSTVAECVADYLLFLLFTGLRRNEAALLTWDRVDLDDAAFEIQDTKNHEPHVAPLSDFLLELLSERRQYAKNAFVFPGDGRKGYIIEPKYQMQKVIETSGVDFRLHDLRRTFATIANTLDLSPYTVKRLLNHKYTSDITASYIVADVERLRVPMQRITDFLKQAMGTSKGRRRPVAHSG